MQEKRPEERERIPAYLRLYERLRTEIEAGSYPEGSRLPSKRTLAADAGLSVITVEHALELLADEGYVEPRQRSGCFVLYRAADFPGAGAERRAAAAACADGEAPAVSYAPMPSLPAECFPFGVLAGTMRRVLSEYGERILIKSPGAGCPELREAICAYLARSRGIHVTPAQVVVGSGAEYLYGLIAQFRGKDGVALEEPCYSKIGEVYGALGVPCFRLPLGPDGLSRTDLAATPARVLHTTPFHSYPSGISVDISKKREYLAWAEKREGLIIEDNYDSELTVSRKAEESLFSLSGGSRVIYLNSFSRTIAPSIRIGYLLLPQELTAEFTQRLGFYSCTVPVFDQYVLAELLENGSFERHLNRVRRQRRKAGR